MRRLRRLGIALAAGAAGAPGVGSAARFSDAVRGEDVGFFHLDPRRPA